MARTPRSEWGALFNFAGGGLVHMELFDANGPTMAGQTLLEWIAAQLLQRGTHTARPAAATVAEGTEYYETDTGNRFKAVASAWVNDGTSATPGGATLKLARVTLGDADVKALPTTPFQLVAAPTGGIQNLFLKATLNAVTAAGAYTNIDPDAYAHVVCGDPADDLLVSQHLFNDPILGPTELTILLTVSPAQITLSMPGRITPTIPDSWGTFPEIYQSTQVDNLPNGALSLHMQNGAAGPFTGGNAANTITVDTLYLELPAL